MLQAFHDELRNKFPAALLLVVVENNLAHADALTRDIIRHDPRGMTRGLTQDKVLMNSTSSTIAYGMFTSDRVPYWNLFQDVVDRNHWNYSETMISLTAYSLRTTFKDRHVTPSQARDHMRKRLEAQLSGLKRLESDTTNPFARPTVTATSHLDFRQKRMPNYHDDCAIVVSFTCYAYRQLARGKLMTLRGIELIRRALVTNEFPDTRKW